MTPLHVIDRITYSCYYCYSVVLIFCIPDCIYWCVLKTLSCGTCLIFQFTVFSTLTLYTLSFSFPYGNYIFLKCISYIHGCLFGHLLSYSLFTFNDLFCYFRLPYICKIFMFVILYDLELLISLFRSLFYL